MNALLVTVGLGLAGLALSLFSAAVIGNGKDEAGQWAEAQTVVTFFATLAAATAAVWAYRQLRDASEDRKLLLRQIEGQEQWARIEHGPRVAVRFGCGVNPQLRPDLARLAFEPQLQADLRELDGLGEHGQPVWVMVTNEQEAHTYEFGQAMDLVLNLLVEWTGGSGDRHHKQLAIPLGMLPPNSEDGVRLATVGEGVTFRAWLSDLQYKHALAPEAHHFVGQRIFWYPEGAGNRDALALR